MSEHLVIGNGEVGSALAWVLSSFHDVMAWDKKTDSEIDRRGVW